MKYSISIIASLLLSVSALSQTQIIFRGDDMGFSHAANIACIDAYKKGVVRAVEVIVPGPWFEEAVELLNKYPELDVGVHLALTSEWRLLKWKPLTFAPTLVDANGYFYPTIWPNENYPGKSLKEHHWDIEEVEREFRAQIEMAKRRIPQVTHFTGHMGCSNMTEEVKELSDKLAKEYNLEISTEDVGLQRLPQWAGKQFTMEQKMERLKTVLKQLKPGKYLSVAHPAYKSEETNGVHHIGYENVGSDRDGETRILISDELKSLITNLDIELVSYEDLKE
jgi:predicted glycoside hydrolase/deacetylase ChbG (UPF0249 family)